MSTLDQVLEEVARRSFYEDSAAQLTDSDGYQIEDTHAGDDMAPDGVQWTYEAGLEATEHRTWSEDSGLMEPCMFFETAGHIRYNLPGAVEALEAGKLVEFSYQPVYIDAPKDIDGRAYDPEYRDMYVYDCDDYVSGVMMDSGELSTDIDQYLIDDVIGWTLLARVYETN